MVLMRPRRVLPRALASCSWVQWVLALELLLMRFLTRPRRHLPRALVKCSFVR